MPSQKFGLEAILSAKLDKRSVEKDVVDKLEASLDKASKIEPEADMGALERQMKNLGGVAEGGLSLSRQSQGALNEHARAMKGSKMGTAVAGGVGGRVGARMGASRAGAAASRGAGALGSLGGLVSGGLLMVGIAGVVGIGILKGVQKMAEASPAWNKTTDMFGMAMNLFFRPVGDTLAKTIFPLMKDFLQLSIGWYKAFQKDGWSGAFGFLDDSFKEALGLNKLEGLIGEVTGLTVDLNTLEWTQVVNPLMWPSFISKILWANFIPSVDWGALIPEFEWPGLTEGAMIAAIGWPVLGPAAIVGAIGWPSLSKGDILAAFGIGGGGGSGPTTTTTNTRKPRNSGSSSGGVLPRTKRVGTNIGVGGSHLTSGDLTAVTYGTGGTSSSPFGVGGSHLTAMATGGITTGPTRAIVGEAGPEAVIPLERLPRLMAEGMKSIGETSHSSTGRDHGADLSEVPDLLRRLISAVEDGGDLTLQVDGETIARTSRNAGDRFLSRREVHK